MLVNTQEFCRERSTFPEARVLLLASQKELQVIYEYWAERLRRCPHGYTVGDITITGHHYFYLNFVQIKLTAKGNKKIVELP